MVTGRVPERRLRRGGRTALTTLAVVSMAASLLLPGLARPSVVHAANDIVVTQTGGVTSVNESGSTDSFTVRLSDAPQSSVVISVTSGDTGEVTVSPSSLTFTTANWNTPQTVTITGVDDTAADGDESTSVALAVVNSASDNAYDGKTATVNATTVDNEPGSSPAFTVTQTGGSNVVSESGNTDSFTVALRSQPSSNVVFSVTGNDSSEATISPANLTFTSSNWNTPQTVTITGVDDTAADGDQTSAVVISVVDTFSATEYQVVSDQTLSILTTDNEAPAAGFDVVESGSGTSVDESGSTDSFTVRLLQEPTSNVVISVTSSDTGEATVSPGTLTFTESNWSTPQTVTVTGVDDTASDGDQSSSVVLSVVDSLSADEYDAVADQTVSVSSTDNEPPAPGFIVRQSDGTSVSEGETTDTFTVVLTSQPNSNVVISVTSTDTDEATVSPSGLTFTPDNWDEEQTVTVTGVDDTGIDGDQTTNVVLAVVDNLSDDDYDAVADQTVSVTTDDDDPRLRVKPDPFSPANGAKLQGLGTTLQWSQEPNTSWFHVQVVPFNSDGPGINMIIGDPALVALGRFEVEAPDFGSADPDYVMLPDITYTWRVRTAMVDTDPAEGEWTDWSAPATFETADKTSASIVRVGPEQGATVEDTTPILRWASTDETLFYYEVQLSADPDFNTNPATATAAVYWELRHGGVTTPPNSYSVSNQYPLESGKTYYWRVRPRIQGDGSPVPWSNVWHFRTP